MPPTLPGNGGNIQLYLTNGAKTPTEAAGRSVSTQEHNSLDQATSTTYCLFLFESSWLVGFSSRVGFFELSMEEELDHVALQGKKKQTKRRREIKWWHSFLPCCKRNDDINDLKKEVEMASEWSISGHNNYEVYVYLGLS